MSSTADSSQWKWKLFFHLNLCTPGSGFKRDSTNSDHSPSPRSCLFHRVSDGWWQVLNAAQHRVSHHISKQMLNEKNNNKKNPNTVETTIWETWYMIMMPQTAVKICSKDCGTTSHYESFSSDQRMAIRGWYWELKLFAITQLMVNINNFSVLLSSFTWH